MVSLLVGLLVSFNVVVVVVSNGGVAEDNVLGSEPASCSCNLPFLISVVVSDIILKVFGGICEWNVGFAVTDGIIVDFDYLCAEWDDRVVNVFFVS